MMKADEIRCIRIDIVDGESTYYCFVAMPGDADDDSWWRRIREFLLSQPRESRGRTLEGSAPMEETLLSGETRRKFVELLESDPTEHKSIRRARKVFPASDDPIVVAYFGEEQLLGDGGR